MNPTVPERKWLTRNALLVILSLVPLLMVAQWVRYRMSHIISEEAVIKANISMIGARIDGRVAEVLVQPNQRIERNQVMARLEDSHLKAAVHLSEIELRRSEDELEYQKSRLAQERTALTLGVENARVHSESRAAAVPMAESSLARWQKEKERLQQVRLPGAISEFDRDDVDNQVKKATHELMAAQSLVQVSKLELQEAENALEGIAVQEQRLSLLARDVELAAARVAQAKADLDAATIRSPICGWVGHRVAGPGASIRMGEPIFSVWEEDQLWVEAWVDESKLRTLGVGSDVTVKLAAHPQEPVMGKVSAIGVLSNLELMSVLNDQQRNGSYLANKVSVRIDLAKMNVKLMPGLSAVVGIRAPNATTVDQLAAVPTGTRLTTSR